MAIHIIDNLLLVTYDDSCQEKYWTLLSSFVEKSYGTTEITDSILIQEILKESFKLLENTFIELIKSQFKASFYLFVYNIHENYSELYVNGKFKDNALFTISRRILTLILEQSCGIELKSSVNYENEINKNKDEYIKLIEELLHIGHLAIELSQNVEQNQLFPKSLKIKVENKILG